MYFIMIAILAIVAIIVAVVAKGTLKLVAAISTIVLIVLAVFSLVSIVPAGHVGVVDTFGNVSSITLKSGLNLVNPFAMVRKLSIQTQEEKEVMDVPSREGLSVSLELSVLYHLQPEKADYIYKSVGEEYAKTILIPNFRAVTRGVTAEYDAKSLYTSDREKLTGQILRELKAAVEPRGIIIEATPLRRVALPQGLSTSIESKLQADQESQRMQFVLLKEKQEAQRKAIEAQGIADFQKIVTAGISEQLLEWKGIEATELLSRSPNSKIIVIGGGKSGLPLILGGMAQ